MNIQREKRIKRWNKMSKNVGKTQNVKYVWMGIPNEEEEKGTEDIFEVTIADNFLKWMIEYQLGKIPNNLHLVMSY